MAALMKNMWGYVKIFCLNHEEPLEMDVTRNISLNSTAFYACTQYFPEKRVENQPPCPNRLNLDDYQGIVLKFFEMVDKEPIGTDMTNCIFDYKGARQKVSVRVLKYSPSKIYLGVMNKTIFNK